MTDKRLLTSLGRYREYMEHDPDTDMLWMFTEEDCTDIVAEARAISDEKPGKDLRHVAKIPQYVLDQAFRIGSFHDKKWWKDWANNPDNAAFRTWKGRV